MNATIRERLKEAESNGELAAGWEQEMHDIEFAKPEMCLAERRAPIVSAAHTNDYLLNEMLMKEAMMTWHPLDEPPHFDEPRRPAAVTHGTRLDELDSSCSAVPLNDEMQAISVGRPSGLKLPYEPPRLAEFMLVLLAKDRLRPSLLDDLEELFQKDLAGGISLSRAKRLYWLVALKSVVPQLWAAARRVGFVGFVADYARRLLH